MKHFDFPNLENINKEYEALVLKPCGTVEDLRSLNLAWNNLNMWVYNAFKRTRIAYNCNTQNETAKKEYHFFSSEILPIIIRFDFEIGRKIVEHPKFEDVMNDFPEYYKRMKIDITIFRRENIPLQVEEEELISQYDALIGGLKVEFKGQSLSFQALDRHLESSDREERKEAFLAREKGFLSITKDLDELFLKMLKLRHQIATNAGFKNYRDYRFQELKRFDYGPKDCSEFHDTIEKHIVPMLYPT